MCLFEFQPRISHFSASTSNKTSLVNLQNGCYWILVIPAGMGHSILSVLIQNKKQIKAEPYVGGATGASAPMQSKQKKTAWLHFIFWGAPPRELPQLRPKSSLNCASVIFWISQHYVWHAQLANKDSNWSKEACTSVCLGIDRTLDIELHLRKHQKQH